jgi:hypothetical protein
MIECKHMNFDASVSVGRLTDGDDGPVTGYTAGVKIKCIDCGIPFEFIGVPGGFSPAQPMVNFDATELRAPIRPSTDPVEHANVILK